MNTKICYLESTKYYQKEEKRIRKTDLIKNVNKFPPDMLKT